MMTNPGALYWHEKSSPNLRLLLNGGWVFKFKRGRRSKDIGTVRCWLALSTHLAELLRVWHPAKTWFILNARGYSWLVSVTPKLTTLEEYTSREKGGRWRRKYFLLFAGFLLSHRLWLDPKYRNYGIDEERKSLFYLDDEVYFRGTFKSWLLRRKMHQVVLS